MNVSDDGYVLTQPRRVVKDTPPPKSGSIERYRFALELIADSGDSYPAKIAQAALAR